MEFLERVEIIDLLSIDNWLVEKIIDFRRQYGLKTPDAIIAATAMKKDAMLLTADKDFLKVKELKTIIWRDK